MYHGERFNSLSHLAGLVLAVVGAVWLLARTVPAGDVMRSAGASVFALAVIVLYAASTLYHASRGPARRRWEKLDHCAIYLLIAGTVTPFALWSMDTPADRWSVAALAAIWGLAAFGIRHSLRATATAQPPLWLYIGMGWLGVLIVLTGWARLSTAGLALLLTGAALYTVGTVFYRNRFGLRHAHGIWHLFVLGGTGAHYLAVASVVV